MIRRQIDVTQKKGKILLDNFKGGMIGRLRS